MPLYLTRLQAGQSPIGFYHNLDCNEAWIGYLNIHLGIFVISVRWERNI